MRSNPFPFFGLLEFCQPANSKKTCLLFFYVSDKPAGKGQIMKEERQQKNKIAPPTPTPDQNKKESEGGERYFTGVCVGGGGGGSYLVL